MQRMEQWIKKLDKIIHEKDIEMQEVAELFECSVCLDEMKPPVKIFQCQNGHVMCESCKNHPTMKKCPTCRHGLDAMIRNIGMEKLGRSYYNAQK